jgi:hypothetical protein
MGVILKNNATSTITTAISASDVGLAVAAGTGSLFPTLGAGDYFYATLVSAGGTYEIVKVTARVVDTMTIVRAQEGTTAQSFASGSRLEVRVTAASVQDSAVQTVVYTVATLPAGVQGSRAMVTDATTTTFASVVAGGGANIVPVVNNGVNWIIG